MEHNPFEPTLEQQSNSPDDFWKGYLGQKVTLLGNLLEEHGDVKHVSVAKALEKAIADVPKKRRDFVSQSELLIRALEWYAKDKNGFVNKKLEKEYVGLMTEELFQRFSSHEFDAVGGLLQEEIDKIVKEKGVPLSDDAVLELRDGFWNRFNAFKMKDYE